MPFIYIFETKIINVMKKLIASISFVFISIFVNAQENHKVTNEVAQAESPNAYFKNYSGNVTISKNELMQIDTLKVHSKDEKVVYIVSSFDITMVTFNKTTGKKLITKTSKGFLLSKESKELLKNVVVGSKVHVDNVKATNSLGKIVKVAGITFNII